MTSQSPAPDEPDESEPSKSQDPPEPAAPDTAPAAGDGDPFHGEDWKTGRDGTPVRRRRRRVSRTRLRRRRRLGLLMLLLGAAVVLGGAWVLVTGLLARSQLQAVRTDVHQLRAQIAAGNLPGARKTAQDIGTHAQRAHDLTTGPAWATVAALPGAAPIRTVRAITDQIDGLGHDVLPRLVDVSTRLDPKALRLPGGRIDVARIAAAAPDLDRASARMISATASIRDQPAHTWVGAVDSARADLLTQLGSLGHTLRSADLATHIAPAMLGQHGVQRYFVAFQNEAEARGTGGLPGAFAILQADHGKLSFERFEPDSTLGLVVPTGLDWGPDYDFLYPGSRSTSLYVNSNVSPHFPYAAQVWIAMWRKHSGERLNGAFAVDPTALSYLMQVAGPATLPNGSSVSAANVVDLTERSVYAKFPKLSQNDARKTYLLALAKAVSKRILGEHGSATALVKAAGRAAGERRLLVYSTDPAVQTDIEQTSLSGAIPRTSAPFVGLAVLNVGSGKLDYYLDRSITWRRTGCGRVRDVTVTMRFTNNAPASGLSPYVTYRQDTHSFPIKPGDSRLAVSYYATAGAKITGVEVDGKPSEALERSDLGHPVFVNDLELPRGHTRTIVYHLREPAGVGAPIVLRQPLVRPLQVQVEDAHCG